MAKTTDPLHRALYLTGSTASGKTALAVELARRLGAEVVSMDSMCLYRGMDIGTAKPTIEERAGVPHHLIDMKDPWESASVADYRQWARTAVEQIESRGRRALFVGGTPLYLKALLRGLFEGPGAVPERREALNAEADRRGDEALHARLAKLDPRTAARLHPHDRRRIIRALEVIAITGVPLSALQAEHNRPAPPQVPVFALCWPRPELIERIDRRVVSMFNAGLVEEVRALVEAPRTIHPVPAQGVGYRETIAYLRGEGGTLDETMARVQARTRQFSKRQATWFRGLVEVVPWPVSNEESTTAVAERMATTIEASSQR
ncbi:tRNA (adenosine(37)-N6)-dimethylallyltransferase MiaA [soil metagenome]